ncbi:hypothetical protein LSH36_745g02059 [Paralvinella palmiformis]|uniref:Uncharacterized protein n=1 Tax=Paralvinella palmiformis TaxID=53620 RepID=A0AAD9J1I3_9ANNE|nr:hypothetical protein LSH36_745g02059 [Paralvinella palmiformis]
MIVFATDEGLAHLALSDVWYMDGTFNSTPLLTLYIIRAPFGDCVNFGPHTKSHDCFYYLMQNKWKLWNVHDIILTNGSRTKKLIGHAHPTIWRAIDGLRKYQAMTSTLIQLDNRGEHPAKCVPHNTVKLMNVYTVRRDGVKSIEDILKGIGHCIRWK